MKIHDSSQEKAAQMCDIPLSDSRSISRASFSNSPNSTERRNFANFFETSPRSRLGLLGKKQ